MYNIVIISCKLQFNVTSFGSLSHYKYSSHSHEYDSVVLIFTLYIINLSRDGGIQEGYDCGDIVGHCQYHDVG